MAERLARLTEAERDVLRLLGKGHDIKTAADALNISSHAATERLCEARRKLEVSSSRQAARLLLAAEAGVQEIWDRHSVEARTGCAGHRVFRSVLNRPILIGVALMSAFAIAAVAWSLATPAEVPVVVTTSPAQSAEVPAGERQIAVTFDQPMQRQSFSFVHSDPRRFPACSGQPRQSPDGRTFSLRCTLQPGQEYEIWFNRGRWMNFKSRQGKPAQPYRLVFRTAP